jgi:hypothetical protein
MFWKESMSVFNATFSNISAISWQPVLLVEKEYLQRTTNHGQATGKLCHLQRAMVLFLS